MSPAPCSGTLLPVTRIAVGCLHYSGVSWTPSGSCHDLRPYLGHWSRDSRVQRKRITAE